MKLTRRASHRSGRHRVPITKPEALTVYCMQCLNTGAGCRKLLHTRFYVLSVCTSAVIETRTSLSKHRYSPGALHFYRRTTNDDVHLGKAKNISGPQEAGPSGVLSFVYTYNNGHPHASFGHRQTSSQRLYVGIIENVHRRGVHASTGLRAGSYVAALHFGQPLIC